MNRTSVGEVRGGRGGWGLDDELVGAVGEPVEGGVGEDGVSDEGHRMLREADLVFCGALGQPLDAKNVLKHFQSVTVAAGLGSLPFRVLRHTRGTTWRPRASTPGVSQTASATPTQPSRSTRTFTRQAKPSG